MSQLPAEDEAELETLLRRLLRSVKERIRGAPSVECAEELLLHLEATDQNFHKYGPLPASLFELGIVSVHPTD